MSVQPEVPSHSSAPGAREGRNPRPAVRAVVSLTSLPNQALGLGETIVTDPPVEVGREPVVTSLIERTLADPRLEEVKLGLADPPLEEAGVELKLRSLVGGILEEVEVERLGVWAVETGGMTSAHPGIRRHLDLSLHRGEYLNDAKYSK